MYYTHRAYTVLDIGGADCWDDVLFDQCHKEKRLLDDSICNLMFQRDTYMHGVQKAHISLTRICHIFNALYLPDSLVDQVKLLAREIEKKDKALAPTWLTLSSMKASLSAVQEDIENVCHENVSLAQKIDDSPTSGLKVVTVSFENSLLQVENFYSLCIF